MSPKMEADLAIGGLGITTPLWLHDIGTGYLFWGAILLLTMRIGLAVRDWIRGFSVDKLSTK